jgi:hypothetical protein
LFISVTEKMAKMKKWGKLYFKLCSDLVKCRFPFLIMKVVDWIWRPHPPPCVYAV